MAKLAENVSQRRTRVAVSVFFFLAGLCFASWASRIPNIQQKLQLNEAAWGGILLALPIGLMVSLPFSGILVARFGSRRMVIISACLYACILPLLGLATNVWQLCAILFTYGFAGNIMNISINTQAVGIEMIYERSIMASFHGVWSIAGFTGALIGTFMVSHSITPFVHFCIITALELLIVFIFYRYTLKEDTQHEGEHPLFAKPDKFLLKLGLIAFCCMICEGTMFDWSGIYFRKVVMPPKEMVTLGYTAFMCTMAGGRFAGDWLSEKLGKKTMIQCSGLVIAVGLLVSVIFPYLVPATIGFLLVGLGVSSVVPLVYATAGKSSTMPAGVAIAATSTIGYFGFLFGPPLIGFIAEASNLRWSFSLIAFLGFCTTVLASVSRIEK